MSDLRVEEHEGTLYCSECGMLAEDPDEPTLRSAAWDHLLESHRARLVSASSEVAVRRSERG